VNDSPAMHQRALTASPPATTAGRLVTPVLLVAGLSVAMAQTIVIAALPVLAGRLQVAVPGAAWLLTAFMLASAVATPVAGRLGDQLGYRPVLLACLCFLVAGTVVTALASQAGEFGGALAGRTLQGLSGGVFPMAFGLARELLPAPRLRSAVAALSAMFGVGGALGMVLAGPVISVAGPAWLSWIILVLALVSLAGAARLPGSARARVARPADPARTAHRVDVPGAVLLSGALVSLLLAISEGGTWGWSSGPVPGLFAGAAVLLAAFAAVELRVAAPLVDLRMLRHRALATTNAATLVAGAAMFGAVTLIPQFVQTPAGSGYGFGLPASATGLVMLPVAALMLVGGPAAAPLATRAGARVPLQLGALLAAASFILLAAAHGGLRAFFAGGAILGAGYGLAFASIGTLVVDAVPPHQTGVATGINTIVRTVGGAIGAQLAATILASSAAGPVPSAAGYDGAFITFAAVAVAAFGLAAAIPRRAGPARSQ
jgi:MFS family permease